MIGWISFVCLFTLTWAHNDRHVTLSCGPESSSEKGNAGPPGKRGPTGEEGLKGDVGPPGVKGEPGDPESWRESFQLLSRQIVELRAEMFSLIPTDCKQVYEGGNRQSGIYTINNNGNLIEVYCDMTTDGGGWTVFQRRINGEQDFYLTWDEYRRGFGNKSREFWMGLDNLHLFTRNGSFELRIELRDCQNQTLYAKYRAFTVMDPSTNFRLRVSDFLGSPGLVNSLGYQNDMPFSTKDRNNDGHRCSVQWHGAWWYNACHRTNLNGEYSPCAETPRSMTWRINRRHIGFRFTEMKFRPL
ncbi:ficolin-1-like [Ciona intestinalis]